MKKSMIKSFSITNEEDEKLKEIGNGSRTSGIKKLIDLYEKVSAITDEDLEDTSKVKMLNILKKSFKT